MLHRRGSRHGLAEIVGTLMLVVIVVAAATAFSFFVAAYQKQLQAEETLSHDKSLEDVRILGLEPTRNPADPSILEALDVEIASLDVNPITIEGITLNGNAVAYFGLENLSGISWPNGCFNTPLEATTNYACVLDLPPDSEIGLDLDLTYGSPGTNTTPGYAFGTNDLAFSTTGLLDFQAFTGLGNEFTQSFVPPVALAGVTFVDSYPILDGTNSYQPTSNSTTGVTVDQWQWDVNVALSPGAVPAGPSTATGVLSFEVPAYYTPVSPNVTSLSFQGTAASGGSVSVGQSSVTVEKLTDTVAVATFTYTYDAQVAGSLYLVAGSLWDNNTAGPMDTVHLAGNSSLPITDTGAFSGEEVELSNPFTVGIPYDIELTVVDSEFLTGETDVDYTFT